jgi:hypothetical protein
MTCSICGQPLVGDGHNAQPVNDGRCCDVCNATIVAASRTDDPELAASLREDWESYMKRPA